MDAARWQQIEAVLDIALQTDPSTWRELLEDRCGHDPALRSEVEDLLSRLATAERLLDSPPADVAAAFVAEAKQEAADDRYVGRRLGPFMVDRQIGRGGMSRVYLAHRADGQFDQQVAVKVLRPGLDSAPDLGRFRRERQILASLSHPNIARLLDGGVTEDGAPYIVMEHVDGAPIDRYCIDRRLSLEGILRLFLTVLDATRYAHRNLVVHRDLKPSNILVTDDGTVKLLDFGLARLLESDREAAAGLTLTERRWMTPEYAAPEQVRGQPATTSTDVYQLGVVLFELATGTLPFGRRGGSLHDLEGAVLEKEPELPSAAAGRERTKEMQRRLRGDLDAVMLRAMRKEPERRYDSVAAFADDLRRHLEGRVVAARAGTARYRMSRFLRRHRVGASVAALAIAALAAFGTRERTLRGHAEAEARKTAAVQEYLVSVFGVADPYAPPELRSADVTARALLDRGVAGIDRALAGHVPEQADLRGVFGRVYANLGIHEQAVAQLQQAVEQRRAVYGPRHPSTAEAMAWLGNVLAEQGKLDEGEPLLREALSIRRQTLGDRSAETAQSLDFLARALQERDDYDAAESLYREALVIRRDLLGHRDALVAHSLNNIGLLFFWRGDYDEAEPLYRDALSIWTERLGENHARTAQATQNLAQVQQLRGQMDDAEQLFYRALAAKRAALGDAHPSVTVNLNNLANFLGRERGKLDEAEGLVREALALDRQMFGENHANVAAGLDNLSTIVRLKGDFAAAEDALRRALAINRSLFGEQHNSVALNLNNIGTLLYTRGEAAAAIPYLRDARAMYSRLLGDEHPFTRTVAANLGRALGEAGQFREAELVLRPLLAVFDTSNAQQVPRAVTLRVSLGHVLTAIGRPGEARPLLEEAASLSATQFGRDDWRSAEASLALGSHLLATGARPRADSLIRSAHATLQPHALAQPLLQRKSAQAVERLRR
jgi:eukaryotic-like serine/threonine-protein kinase